MKTIESSWYEVLEKQTWKVIAALLFAVDSMGDRKINVKAESMETGILQVKQSRNRGRDNKETTEKTLTAGIVTVRLPLILTALRSSWFLTCLSNRLMDEMLKRTAFP
ncbi:MAG: hypothetical protein ACLRMZ_26850 [Blautia marasmi]